LLIPVTDHIKLVEAPQKGRFPWAHGLLVEDATTVLIDTGFGQESLNQLKKIKIDYLLNSHFHEDHVLLNRAFPDVPLLAPAEDADGLRCRQTYIDWYGFEVFNAAEIGRRFMAAFDWMESKVSGEFSEGQVWELGECRMEAVHTPGHTNGHYAFWFPREKVLFTADIDLTGFGPWYGNLTSDVDEFIASIKRLQSLGAEIAVTSHKGIIDSNLNQQWERYLNRIYEREEKLLKYLSSPHTLDEIAAQKIMYGRHPEPEDEYFFFERCKVFNHLQRLLRLGWAEEREGKYISTRSSVYGF